MMLILVIGEGEPVLDDSVKTSHDHQSPKANGELASSPSIIQEFAMC